MFEPTIDMEPFTTAPTNDSARVEVVNQLREACTETGFFQVVGHGVSLQLQRDLELSARRFFGLSEDQKAEIAMTRGGSAWRGWFPVGGELTSGVPDAKEGIYFGTDLPDTDPAVRSGRPLHGPNLYPAQQPEMAPLIREWMRQVTTAGRWVLRGLASGLGLSESWFDRWCMDPVVLFRIFHYPTRNGAAQNEWGVAEHTDYGLLTLVAQDETGGLEVHGPSGWVDVAPTEGALVCNLGDMIERVTGGTYRSTPHRVRTPTRDRISMPLFLDPAWDAVVSPLPGYEPDPEERTEAASGRWDDASVFDGATRYGDYLSAKVARVFPELFVDVIEPED